MNSSNEIRLRLRFYKDVAENADVLRQKFAHQTTIKNPDYFLKIRGYHIWFNIKGAKKTYYSPHLHIELEPKGESETHIRGLFGPDPTLWTFFMFLHFIIAGLFLIFWRNCLLKLCVEKPLSIQFSSHGIDGNYLGIVVFHCQTNPL